MFTSGVVSTREGRRIALFFSGRQHAGENLKDVLDQRAAELDPPIQMCDGLSRNLPGEDERLAEPNSVLGQAIQYMLKHWKPLTLFLRKAGATQ